jgi:hypothetical protein
LARDSKTGKCKAHGGGPRCSEPNCDKAARDIESMKCKAHGGGPVCDEEGCKNAARSVITMKCKAHGGGPRCSEPNCKKPARDSQTMKCKIHGGGPICNEAGCNNAARDVKSMKCKAHGGGLRCPNCIDWIDSRGGDPKYDNYCATCFKQVFPEDERSKVIYTHTKEIRVRNMINENFKGFIHDKPLYTGECSCVHRRRIDHRKLIDGTLLCIETDEFAHSRYDMKDEETRYDDLYMIHSGKWIFIRFNPDKKGIDMEDKLNRLLQEINYQIERIKNEENTELVEIIKLFY